jgi:16S rRNA (cytosine967-C5)-methyltransferase
MKISPARLAAFEILHRIETDRAYSSALLPLYEEHLSHLDRGLCHELVLGVLRKQIYLDKVIDRLSKGKKLDAAVRIALRIGAYQLMFLERVPAYSSINESVNLVQKARKTSAKGLVNAVLRRISEGVTQLEFVDDVERISVETSHPRWLIEKWIDDFGRDEVARIATANNDVPRVAFRVTRRGTELEVPEVYKRSEFVKGCMLTDTIDDELRSAANAGEIYFQDEASQMVAQVAANGAGHRILDVCAAPGGKTTQIAAFIEDPAKVLLVAGDLHTSRVKLLSATCKNQGAGFVNVMQYDAEVALPFADESFDTVLIDAPCSGTGTIRHNPEIRYFLAATDFPELSKKQLAILRNASKLVQRGGRLIYSTCSLQIEENEAVCKAFLDETENFKQVVPDVPDRFRTSDGFARTFPARDNMDGFFIAEFRRI